MSKRKILNIIDKFKNKKIGVIGDLMLDEFISGDVERISPEAPIPVVLVDKETFMPGGAANVANNIASLGGKTFLVGSVGNDKAAKILCRVLKKNNINIEGVFSISNKPTTQKTRIIARSQQIVRLDREKTTEYIKKEIEEKAVKFIKSHIRNWDALIISDYDKGFITPYLAKKIIILTKRYNKPIIVDTKKFSHAPFFKGITLITPNFYEAKNITGLNNLRKVGRAIQKNLECNVLITQGKEGMTLFEGKKIVHFSVKAREVFDVSGAGDTVVAALVLGLVSGANFEEATAISNCAAGIVVEKAGTAVITVGELKNDLQESLGGIFSKIKNQEEIFKIRKDLKESGKKLSVFSGSFDILHVGHIRALQEAKRQGDYLLVLLNSDKSVRSYKGPGHPINTEDQRAMSLAALEFVDYVTIFDEINPKKVLEKIKPDIYCNGSDWGINCVERDVVEKNGGKMYVLKWTKNFSTTKTTEKIINTHFNACARAVFLDRDGTINENNPEYVHKMKDFKFVPGVIDALRKLSNTSYKIIILTNQSGIARGYFTEKDLKNLHQWMLEILKKKGVRIDKIYYCPHGPDSNCSCRKPAIGMVLKAGEDFGISLNKSWIIGDDQRDIIMGREVNLKTIKISGKMPKTAKLAPHYYASNISEAVDVILSAEDKK